MKEQRELLLREKFKLSMNPEILNATTMLLQEKIWLSEEHGEVQPSTHLRPFKFMLILPTWAVWLKFMNQTVGTPPLKNLRLRLTRRTVLL